MRTEFSLWRQGWGGAWNLSMEPLWSCTLASSLSFWACSLQLLSGQEKGHSVHGQKLPTIIFTYSFSTKSSSPLTKLFESRATAQRPWNAKRKLNARWTAKEGETELYSWTQEYFSAKTPTKQIRPKQCYGVDDINITTACCRGKKNTHPQFE